MIIYIPFIVCLIGFLLKFVLPTTDSLETFGEHLFKAGLLVTLLQCGFGKF